MCAARVIRAINAEIELARAGSGGPAPCIRAQQLRPSRCTAVKTMPKAAVAELPLEIAVAEEHGRSVSAEERASYVERYRSGPTDAAAARFESLPAATVAALSEPFPVTQEMIDQYHRDGFVHVRGVLPPELVEVLGDSIRLHTMVRMMKRCCTSRMCPCSSLTSGTPSYNRP